MENKNTKKKTIAYWIFTGILAFQLLFSGLGAILKMDMLVEAMNQIGLPLYFMNILGIAYVLGAIAIVFPKWPKLKEWAHAGVTFAMLGAISAHISIGDTLENTFASIIVLILNIGSYLLRPTMDK